MPPIKSPKCAKGHAWSKHGRSVMVRVKRKDGSVEYRSRNVCLICTKAYQAQYKRKPKVK
jgi:hypothetical protein